MFYRRNIFFFLSFLLFFLSACSWQSKIIIQNNDDLSSLNNNFYQHREKRDPAFIDWTEINKGIEIKNYYLSRQNLKKKITFVRIKKKLAFNYFFDILEDKKAKLMSRWAYDYPDAILIINGVFFNENFKASGGRIYNDENNLYSPEGENLYKTAIVIDKDNQLDLIDLREGQDLNKYKKVFVNFPLLIKNGEKEKLNNEWINLDEKASRSIIAKDNDYFYFINTDQTEMSLSEIQNFLYDNFKMQLALNLDGGSSSSMYLHWENNRILYNSLKMIANVIIVKER